MVKQLSKQNENEYYSVRTPKRRLSVIDNEDDSEYEIR